MAIAIEPIPVVPNPVPNKVIVAYQRGAYDPYVQDSEGNQLNFITVVKELFEEMDASGAVNTRFNVQNGYVGASVATLADEEWMFDNPSSALVLQSMPLPSISDLGIDTEKYQVFVKTILVCQDALDTESTVATRLINMVTGQPVSGSAASKEITTGGTETTVESDWFECPTNGHFFLDFRTPGNALANGAQARRQSMLIRIVRR